MLELLLSYSGSRITWKVEMEAHLPHLQDQPPKDLLTDQLKHQAIAMLVGLGMPIVMISTTLKNVSMMAVTVAKKIPQKDGTIIARHVNVLMPLNQLPKHQLRHQ
jgi:hypothetical protein